MDDITLIEKLLLNSNEHIRALFIKDNNSWNMILE